MKLITFTVPSYNSQDYLSNCLESLLVGGEDVEIIIVNDGSKDRTLEIAREYESKYPTIIRVVDKENGGHGSGVNKGVELATGLYFKVVDSDDWLGKEALLKVLATIKENLSNNVVPDLYITNFIYDHTADGTQKVSHFRKFIPKNKLITWKETKKLTSWHLLLMHSLLYKLDVVRESGVKLPEHTFYVDNIFAYIPLPYVKSIYYLDVNLYHYFIGRADQSVTIENIVKRYDQQLRCMKILIEAYSYEELMKMEKHLRNQMFHILGSIMMNTVFFTTTKDSKERREGYANLWNSVKEKDYKMYKFLRNKTRVIFLKYLPWKAKGKVTTWSYNYLCKHVKLG